MESLNSDLELAPYLLLELAANIYPLEELSERWSIPVPRLKKLAEHPAIRRQLEQKRSELESSGMTFRMKAAAGAEIILQRIIQRAQLDETSFSQLLDAERLTSQLADLMPRQNSLGGPGTGYSLTINMGGVGADTTITASMAPQPVDVEDVDILNTADPLNQAPQWLAKIKHVPELVL